MNKYNLKPEYIRRLVPNIGAKRIAENVKPNLVNRKFKTKGLNQIWCTDITYLIWGNKRAYLSTIIDLYDRHVVAYQISKFNNIPLVLNTLNKALEIEKDVHGLIIHSDQGFQYTSFEYKAVCASKGISISMSRKGTPIDDSPMESWHGILKKETLYNNNITSLEHYIQLVEEWIAFYNSSTTDDLATCMEIKVNGVKLNPTGTVSGNSFTDYPLGEVTLAAGKGTIEIKCLTTVPCINMFRFLPKA